VPATSAAAATTTAAPSLFSTTTTPAPAPATTGLGGLFSGAAAPAAPAATPAPGAASSTALVVAAPAPKENPDKWELPAKYKSYTVEEIMTDWRDNLKRDTEVFDAAAVWAMIEYPDANTLRYGSVSAKKVAAWDESLRASQEEINDLVQKGNRLFLAQKNRLPAGCN